MTLVEGIGDEVLFLFGLITAFIAVVIAWASTRVRPLFNTGPVWMVHMQTAPERRVLEVYSLDENEAANRQVAASVNGEEAVAVTEPINSAVSLTDDGGSSDSTSTSGDETDQTGDQSQHVVSTEPNEISSEENIENLPRQQPSVSDSPPSTAENSSRNAPIPTVSREENNSSSATIKLKFFDDTQRLVATWLTQTVGEFKRQHFDEDVSQGKMIRLIYRGQLLRDDSRSLASYGLHENCVLHCHVSTTPYPSSPSDNNTNRRNSRGYAGLQNSGASNNLNTENNGFDIGRYVYFIFAFKFAALWSAWFVFPEYFSRTSFVSLMLCSGVFMLFWYGSQRRGTAAVANANRT